jgi:DHA2 family lincomycin resistance protein-like MFS transporter
VLVIPGAIGLLASSATFVALGSDTAIWQILVAHVVLMVSLAALFTPVFTMGLGSLPAHLYSHGSSLLGTVQQVAGAMGTALVVTVMSSRATSLVGDGISSVTAQLGGLRWAFAVSAVLCAVVLGLVFLLPARMDDPAQDEPALDPDLDRELDRECAAELDGELEHDLEQECAKLRAADPV